MGQLLEEDHLYTKESIGDTFPFLNREVSSAAIFDLFQSQEALRSRAESALKRGDHLKADCWDKYKRDIIIPVCMGLAGMGKSTAARRSVAAHLSTIGDPKDLASYHGDDKKLLFCAMVANADLVCNYRIGE